MIKLYRNNLYFKNVTSKFTDSGIKCFSCKTEDEDRVHFFICKIHTNIINKLFQCYTNLGLLKKSPEICPFFYNHTIPMNHPTNSIYMSIIKYMYNLRYSEIIPNLQCVGGHVSRFVATAIQMYPSDVRWQICQKIPLMLQYI